MSVVRNLLSLDNCLAPQAGGNCCEIGLAAAIAAAAEAEDPAVNDGGSWME